MISRRRSQLASRKFAFLSGPGSHSTRPSLHSALARPELVEGLMAGHSTKRAASNALSKRSASKGFRAFRFDEAFARFFGLSCPEQAQRVEGLNPYSGYSRPLRHLDHTETLSRCASRQFRCPRVSRAACGSTFCRRQMGPGRRRILREHEPRIALQRGKLVLRLEYLGR